MRARRSRLGCPLPPRSVRSKQPRGSPIHGPLHDETAPDLDNIIGYHTQSYPALHAVESALQAPTHTMSRFSALMRPSHPGPPPLSTTKPALSITSFAFRTLRLLIRHRKPSHAHGTGSFFILLRVEPRTSGPQAGIRPNLRWWTSIDGTNNCRSLGRSA